MTSSFALALLLVLLSKRAVFGAALMSVCCAASLRKAYGRQAEKEEAGVLFDRRGFIKGILCISLGALAAGLFTVWGEGRELLAIVNSSILLADTFLVTLIVFSFGVILCRRRTLGGGKKKDLYFVTSCTVPTCFFVLYGDLCRKNTDAAALLRPASVAGHAALAVGSAVLLFTAFALCPKRNGKNTK